MDNVLDKIPSQETVEKRFLFIENLTLRTNVVIAFRYMFFLLILVNDTKLPGPISYSIYKDIILYTATIAESCIHYGLKRLIELGKTGNAEIMPEEWKDSKCIDTYTISSDEKVCGVVRHKTYERFSSNTQFQTLNRAALKAGLFNKGLFEEVEQLREKRNRIHLAGLTDVDDYYQKSDVTKMFETTNNILKAIEHKIKGS